MRILYMHQYFTTPEMAGGTRSYGLANRLVKKGHEVTIVTSWRGRGFPGNERWHVTEEDGIEVHWVRVPYSNEMGYRERIFAFSKYAFLASTRSASINSDIVFATSTPLTIALPAVYVSKTKRIPMVLEVRDLWPEIPIAVGALRNPLVTKAAKWLEVFAYRNSNRIIALSEGMKEGIVSKGFPSENVSVIPNCCDLKLFGIDSEEGSKLRFNYEWLLDRPLVIYAGTVGLVNGIEYMVRLSNSVRSLDPEIRFLVLGDGREREKAQRLADEMGTLNENFFMLPEVPKSEVPVWLGAADIATSFVIDRKELWNNSANKFFDALAAGKPVAINHGGWQAEVLRETGAGLVLDVADIQSAAEDIVAAIRNSKWLERAGRAARKLAEERYSLNKLAGELESVLFQAVNEKL